MDRSGHVVVPPRFTKVELAPSSEGFAIAYENQKGGYLDERGAWAIEPAWDIATPMHGGYARVALVKGRKARWWLLDDRGRLAERLNDPTPGSSAAPVRVGCAPQVLSSPAVTVARRLARAQVVAATQARVGERAAVRSHEAGARRRYLLARRVRRR